LKHLDTYTSRYIWRIKAENNQVSTAEKFSDGTERTAVAYEVEEAPMVRTQFISTGRVYFVQREASRRDEPMAAVIPDFIDEKWKFPRTHGQINPC